VRILGYSWRVFWDMGDYGKEVGWGIGKRMQDNYLLSGS
jgi:hypothetical protein